jgi:hypothetical protein
MWKRGSITVINDVRHYIVIRKLLCSILNNSGIHKTGAKFRHNYAGFFFRKVAFGRYNVHWLVEKISFLTTKELMNGYS